MNTPIHLENAANCFIYTLLFTVCLGSFSSRANAQNATGVKQEGIVTMPSFEVVARRTRDWKYVRTDNIEFLTDMGGQVAATAMAKALDMAVAHAEAIFPHAAKVREIPIKIVLFEAEPYGEDSIPYRDGANSRRKIAMQVRNHWAHLSNYEQYIIARNYTKRGGKMYDSFFDGIWIGADLLQGGGRRITRPLDSGIARQSFAENLFVDCFQRANGRNYRIYYRSQPWANYMVAEMFWTFYTDIYAESDHPNQPTYARLRLARYDVPNPDLVEINPWERGPFIPLKEVLAIRPPGLVANTGTQSPKAGQSPVKATPKNTQKSAPHEVRDIYRPPEHPTLSQPRDFRADREIDPRGNPARLTYEERVGEAVRLSAMQKSESEILASIQHKVWSRECLDFGYYCLLEKPGKYKTAWARFFYALHYQPVSEELFTECFGLGFEEFKKEMYDHYTKLPNSQILWGWGPSDYSINIYKDGKKPGNIKLHPPTQAQTARMLSESMAYGERVTPEYFRNVLLNAARLPQSLDDPDFTASLGLNEMKYGSRDKAIELLERATADGVERASAYRTLSQLRLEKLLAEKDGSPVAKLTAQEAASVLDPLLQAHKQRQSSGQTYIQMAEIWSHTDSTPPESVFNLIGAGCLHFPNELDLLEAVLPLLEKYKKKAMLTAIFNNSAKWIFSQADKKRYEKLVRQFEASPR